MSNTTTIPNNPVVYAELQTTDPDRARRFYGELLGWKTDEETTPAGPYWMFQGQLAGMTGPREGVPSGWVSYLATDDVATATKRARALGAQVLRDCISIPEGTFSVIADPLGGVIGLFQTSKR